jgi:hypothetical protein
MSDKAKEEYYKNHNYNILLRYIVKMICDADQQDRLTKSEVFCMIPWIHIHAFPDGRAYPCCLGEMIIQLADLNKIPCETVWNSPAYKRCVKNMLEENHVKNVLNVMNKKNMDLLVCVTSTNKNFGHHIDLVDQTQTDGTFEDFKLRYYDIRFSNLCNMSCRTCGRMV